MLYFDCACTIGRHVACVVFACKNREQIGELREQVRLKNMQIETCSKLNADLEREVRYLLHLTDIHLICDNCKISGEMSGFTIAKNNLRV